MFFCFCMMERNCLSRLGARSRISWNSSSTTIIRSCSECAFSIRVSTSSISITPSTPGWNAMSIEPVKGLVDIIGITRKWVIRCRTRSIGCTLKNSFSSLADRSETEVACCKFTVICLRPVCFTALATTLLLPKRRGLISTKWLALFTNFSI